MAAERRRRVPTAALNRVLREVDLPPAAAHRERPAAALLLRHAGADRAAHVRPLRQRRGGVHFSYRRYLENRLREAFGFGGTPMRMIIRERARVEPAPPKSAAGRGQRGKAVQRPVKGGQAQPGRRRPRTGRPRQARADVDRARAPRGRWRRSRGARRSPSTSPDAARSSSSARDEEHARYLAGERAERALPARHRHFRSKSRSRLIRGEPSADRPGHLCRAGSAMRAPRRASRRRSTRTRSCCPWPRASSTTRSRA